MGLISKAKGAPRTICNVCSNDITSTVRIHCASKQCTDYDLCVTCFSQGQTNLHHDPRTHSYQVIEPHSIPIFDPGWGADEELLLLEGAEQYGLGSWADIVDHIGGYREKDEVRDHYIQTYIASPRFPLPERASPGDKRLSESMPREEFQANKKRRIEQRKQAIADEAAVATTGAPTPAKPTSSVPSCHEVAGYMPGRLEFENEYFNEAEEVVQHMHFNPDEGINPATKAFDPETELKMVVMGIYNDRLTSRTDRKRIIFNHHLLEYRKNTALDKKRTKEQRDLHHRLKPLARIMSHPDFLALSADLEQEQNLRQAIAQLQEWRRMRLSTLASGERYEVEKAARLARSAPPLGAFDRLPNGLRLGKAPAPVEVSSAVSDYTTRELPVRLPPSTTAYSNTPSHPNGSINGHGNAGLQTPPTSEASPKQTQTQQSHPRQPSQPPHQPPQRAPLPPIPNLVPAKFDEDSAPDWQLLDASERDLCSKLRLQPKAYLCIKEAVMQEAQKFDGRLKKKNVREICKVDTTKGGRIFEFLCDVGWIGNAAKS